MNKRNRMKQVGAWAKGMRMVVKRERMISSTALTLLVLVAGIAQGATVTWQGAPGATNDWETAGNWNPNGAPTDAYVKVANGGTVRITTATVTNSYLDVGIIGNGYVIQNGGALTFTNTTSTSIGRAGGTGVYTLNAGALTVSGGNYLYVGYGSGSIGTLNIAAGGAVAVNLVNDMRLGDGTSGNSLSRGTAVVNGGTLTVGGMLSVGTWGTGSLIVSNNGTATVGALQGAYNSGSAGTITVASGGILNMGGTPVVGRGGYGTMTIDGGTVNVTGSSGFFYADYSVGSTGIISIVSGTLNSALREDIGEKGYGQMIVNGGTNNANGGIFLGNSKAVGQLIISNGLVNTPFVQFSYSSATGQVFLSGGTLAVGSGGVWAYTTAGDVSEFFFDGGTLKATTNNSSFMTATLSSATITTNGAVIDDGGYAVTIAQVLKDAPGQVGKLTKKGAGTLTLSATNTFSGDVTVTAGTLALTKMLSTNVCVTIATGATNNLAFTGTNTIRRLSVNGELLQPNRVYGANNNGGAGDLSPALSGGGYYYTTEGAPPRGTMVRFL